MKKTSLFAAFMLLAVILLASCAPQPSTASSLYSISSGPKSVSSTALPSVSSVSSSYYDTGEAFSTAAPASDYIWFDGDDAVVTISSIFTARASIDHETTAEEYRDEWLARAGVKSAVLNNDYSVTLVMSRETYQTMLQETRASILRDVDSFINNDEFVVKIEYTEDLSVFDVYVTQGFEGLFGDSYAYSIGLQSMFYENLLGMQDLRVTLHEIDNDTGEIIDTVNYPDRYGE